MGEQPGSHRKVMEITDIAEAFAWQAQHAEKSGAPITGRIINAAYVMASGDSATGRRIANWQGLSLEDAMPLRIAGAIHFLYLKGEAPQLEPVYAGRLKNQARIDELVSELAHSHDHVLLPWLDGPPQTNEAGRSASVMAGLLWLSGKVGTRFELFEIGASAGINTMMDRYFYDLGGTRAGVAGSVMQIVPEWRGAAPPSAKVEISTIKGCDIAPVDLSDPAQALRLKAYIWADALPRMARMDAAIALASEQAPDLIGMDAAEFVAQQLARPQDKGTTRALFHTVMWQYLPETTRNAISASMEQAGSMASADKPLAWLRVETNRATFNHELTVRYWNGSGAGEEWVELAEAHPHGAWIDWQGSN